MLHRTKPKKNLSKLVWRAADIMIAALGLFAFYVAVTGVWNGEVEVFSKRVSGTISWAQDPLWFIGTVVAWAGGGVFLLCLAASDKGT